MKDLGKVVDGDEVGTWDGIIRIIYGDKCKEIILAANGDENDKFLCLNDCLKIVGYNEDCLISVMVIIEDWTSGVIYRYGAYSEKCWEIHGETKGFV